jgi:hypothetical protein
MRFLGLIVMIIFLSGCTAMAGARAEIAHKHLMRGDCEKALHDVSRLKTAYTDQVSKYQSVIDEIMSTCGNKSIGKKTPELNDNNKKVVEKKKLEQVKEKERVKVKNEKNRLFMSPSQRKYKADELHRKGLDLYKANEFDKALQTWMH